MQHPKRFPPPSKKVLDPGSIMVPNSRIAMVKLVSDRIAEGNDTVWGTARVLAIVKVDNNFQLNWILFYINWVVFGIANLIIPPPLTLETFFFSPTKVIDHPSTAPSPSSPTSFLYLLNGIASHITNHLHLELRKKTRYRANLFKNLDCQVLLLKSDSHSPLTNIMKQRNHLDCGNFVVVKMQLTPIVVLQECQNVACWIS